MKHQHHEGHEHRHVQGVTDRTQGVVIHKAVKGSTPVNLDWLEPELAALIPSLTEAQIVATVLYGEARSEPIQGIVAVANIIRNRVKTDLHSDSKADWWGEGYPGVCLKSWQFSCWSPKGGQKNYEQVFELVQDFASKKPITDPLARQCIGVALCVIGDYFLDNVKGACHYHTAAMKERPKWAQHKVPSAQIGAHVFYSGIERRLPEPTEEDGA